MVTQAREGASSPLLIRQSFWPFPIPLLLLLCLSLQGGCPSLPRRVILRLSLQERAHLAQVWNKGACLAIRRQDGNGRLMGGRGHGVAYRYSTIQLLAAPLAAHRELRDRAQHGMPH